MVNFCRNCGEKIESDKNNFCPKCGERLDGTSTNTAANTTKSGINCTRCGTTIPLGQFSCPNCGKPINEEKHTALIVIGYILSIIIPIGGTIIGIYLLTRENKDVHKHGIIMIVISVILMAIWFILYFAAMNYYSSPYYYYYY